MTISKVTENEAITIKIEGRIDTTTAPQFEAEIDNCTDAKNLVLDFEGVEYISSAGLRVVLKAQKMMAKNGSMKLINVNADVMEVFDITGFVDILTIE